MNFTDWQDWQPQERATLCFVVRAGQILLIRKKRGLGAGKMNGPGGRLEPGETAAQAAIRETEEELGITPLDLSFRGELYFQFADGYSLQCSVFTAKDHAGEPIETDEAIPHWTPLDRIPYEEMWADDALWMPGMLAGRKFHAFFHFDGENLLQQEIFWLDPANLA